MNILKSLWALLSDKEVNQVVCFEPHEVRRSYILCYILWEVQQELFCIHKKAKFENLSYKQRTVSHLQKFK